MSYIIKKFSDVCNFSNLRLMIIFLFFTFSINGFKSSNFFYICYLVILGFATFIVLWQTKNDIYHKRPNFSLTKTILKILSGSGNSIEVLILFFVSFIMLGWVGDYLRELFINNQRIINLLKSIDVMLALLCINLKYIEKIIDIELSNLSRGGVGPTPTKVLIMALSMPNKEEKTLQEFIDDLRKCIIENSLDKSKANWALPLRAILFAKDKLEACYCLVSQQIDKNEELKEGFLSLVKELKKKFNIKLELDKFEFSRGLDFDDYHDVFCNLDSKIMEYYKNDYKDVDITMNISSGTSAVTSAMIIAAVKDGRQIIYFTQINKPADIKSFNITVKDVYLAMNEVAE